MNMKNDKHCHICGQSMTEEMIKAYSDKMKTMGRTRKLNHQLIQDLYVSGLTVSQISKTTGYKSGSISHILYMNKDFKFRKKKS